MVNTGNNPYVMRCFTYSLVSCCFPSLLMECFKTVDVKYGLAFHTHHCCPLYTMMAGPLPQFSSWVVASLIIANDFCRTSATQCWWAGH